MFKKILIADRGDISIRIARTCKRMGMDTVAVYTESDREAPHLEASDSAVQLPAGAGYGDHESLIAIAREAGVEAVHPGHSTLGQDAVFARAVREADLVFVGPEPESLAIFTNKLEARKVAQLAGVRVVAGSEKHLEDLDAAAAAAQDLGYPVFLKPVVGSNAEGLQRVEGPESLEGCWQALQDHVASRGETENRDVYMERALDRPRHIEIQVLGDSGGELVAVADRECSIQQDRRKLLEESPAPAFIGLARGEETRDAMYDSAARIAREVRYTNLGSAEFLLDASGSFHFLEFNPGLQVEHGVTEMRTGLDLVELQLNLAAGESLPDQALRATTSGYAMEARIFAEPPGTDDSAAAEATSLGEVKELRWPNIPPGQLRVETVLQPNTTVTADHGPLLAKLIAFGPTRHRALLLLDRTLAETELSPITNNLTKLRKVLNHECFRAGQYDTEFIERSL